MYFYEEKADKKPKDLALLLNVEPEKVSEWAKDLERYGITKFSRTPFGSLLFKDSETKLLREYGVLKTTIGNTQLAIEILKETDFIPKETEDLSWAKNLKSAIWRRH